MLQAILLEESDFIQPIMCELCLLEQYPSSTIFSGLWLNYIKVYFWFMPQTFGWVYSVCNAKSCETFETCETIVNLLFLFYLHKKYQFFYENYCCDIAIFRWSLFLEKIRTNRTYVHKSWYAKHGSGYHNLVWL